MTEINWVQRAETVTLQVRNFIDGEYRECRGKDTLAKHSGRDGRLLYELPSGEEQEVEDAVANAKAAFEDGRWSRLPVQQRKKILFTLADLIETHAEELALNECLDVGKPIANALGQDVPAAAATIRSNAEGADKLYSNVYTDGPAPNMIYQLRKPVGVVGGIIGWNFPLGLATTKVGPALAMGNSLVLKPSEFTSLSAGRLAELAVEAGVPPGVFNVVHGSGAIAGHILAHHPDVNLLTFTGSSSTGKQMMIAAGQSNMKRLMLECGGKSPFIIFDDCSDNLDFIVQDAVWTAFQNQGEVCAAGTRLLIQESIKDKIMPKLLEQAAAIKPQDPLDPNTNFGALLNEPHTDKVLGYIANGKQEGAKLILGGNRVREETGGCYVEPTIFTEVDPKQRIAQEEIFGPVLSVFSFRDETEAIKLANDSTFGLGSNVCTTNIGRAQRLALALNAGVIGILGGETLSPGGVDIGAEGHKQSGFGAEHGMAGLASYSVSSSVYLFA